MDRIITDLAAFDVEDEGGVLRRLAPGVNEATVRERTDVPFRIELEEVPV